MSSEIKYDSFMTAETFRNELPRKSSNITFHALYNIIIDVLGDNYQNLLVCER